LIDQLNKYSDELPKNTVLIPKRANSNDTTNYANCEAIDPYTLVEPVDILNKYEYNLAWCEKVLSNTNWTMKKPFLEDFIAKCKIHLKLNSEAIYSDI